MASDQGLSVIGKNLLLIKLTLWPNCHMAIALGVALAHDAVWI